MRLFIYYAVHSFLNTLKKLLKTWVAVFLVIGIGGALIGGIIGLVASAVVKDDEPEQKIEMTDPEEETPEDDKEKTDEDGFELHFSFGEGLSGTM